MNISASLPGKIKLALILLLAIALSAGIAGCDLFLPETPAVPFEDEQPLRQLSIADLAELASPSIAYIEAWESAYPDYYSIGSGFVISADGRIVTNYHVMEGSDTATVEIDGRIFKNASVLAFNEEWDLAILKVEADNLKPLRLASGIDDIRLGEQVVAMGNPEGFKQTVSDGIVSTLQRRLEGFNYDHIQTTAPISKGSSGGPLLSMRGEVIGVNTLTYMTGQNLNFAVPVDLIHTLIAEIGPARSIGEVFSYRYAKGRKSYEAKAGELAVILSWDGGADLDLEIWSEDFEYLGNASAMGSSPDITHGSQGEEWFVFEESALDTGERVIDFSQGRYIISAYYFGPEPADGIGAVDLTLEVSFPNGWREVAVVDELWYAPPYDQWFALLIDVDAQDYKILDLYLDAPVVAMLEWDTEANLDLLVWDIDLERLFYPDDFWYGYDFVDGRHGIESFRFAELDDLWGDYYDFTGALLDIYVFMENPGVPETTAVVTLLTDDYDLARYEHRFTADERGEYFWIVAYDFDMTTLEYFLPEPEDARFYLDD